MTKTKSNTGDRGTDAMANVDRPGGLTPAQLQELAERVYELLRAELRIEQERRGHLR